MDEDERSEVDEWLQAELGTPDSPKSWIYYDQKKREDLGAPVSYTGKGGYGIMIAIYVFLIVILILVFSG